VITITNVRLHGINTGNFSNYLGLASLVMHIWLQSKKSRHLPREEQRQDDVYTWKCNQDRSPKL